MQYENKRTAVVWRVIFFDITSDIMPYSFKDTDESSDSSDDPLGEKEEDLLALLESTSQE